MLEAYCRFAERWNLYLIVDEIYALSVYESGQLQASLPSFTKSMSFSPDLSPIPFTSVLSIDAGALGCDPRRIIQLYGMSKDFGANGFRVGVMVTQHNTLLQGAMSPYGMLMKIGSPVVRAVLTCVLQS